MLGYTWEEIFSILIIMFIAIIIHIKFKIPLWILIVGAVIVLVILNLLSEKKYQKGIRIIDPERLHQIMRDNSYSKNYRKYKKIYHHGNLIKAQREFNEKGRWVKYWRLVASRSDVCMDEYIPIFYKRKKHRRRKHRKRKKKK